MLQSVDLRDYMVTSPIKVKEDANLFDAMKAIIDNKVSGGVCVINKDKALVGSAFRNGLFSSCTSSNL